MKRKKVIALSAVVASSLVGLGLVATGTANAGTNGQAVRICISSNNDPLFAAQYQTVGLEGINQNGEKTTVSLPLQRVGCTEVPNAFWVGTVNAMLTQSAAGAADSSAPCDVPEEFDRDLVVLALSKTPDQGVVCTEL